MYLYFEESFIIYDAQFFILWNVFFAESGNRQCLTGINSSILGWLNFENAHLYFTIFNTHRLYDCTIAWINFNKSRKIPKEMKNGTFFYTLKFKMKGLKWNGDLSCRQRNFSRCIVHFFLEINSGVYLSVIWHFFLFSLYFRPKKCSPYFYCISYNKIRWKNPKRKGLLVKR